MTGACVILAGLLVACPVERSFYASGPGPGTRLPAALASPGGDVPVSLAPPWAAGDRSRRDPWLGEDKARHFALSFAATAFAYAGARTTLDPEPARFAAAVAALSAGTGKEIHDARAGRWFSFRDMAWNVAGVALGYAFVSHVR